MKLAYGIFYTDDLMRAAEFYEDQLGFEIASNEEDFVAFKIGDTFLGIKLSGEEREVPGHQTAIISVEDVEEWYEKLKRKNILLHSDLEEAPWGRNFSILDPDGNKVEFVS